MSERERFADRLDEAGLDPKRFIPVQDGEKGTRMSGHQKPENWLPADASRLGRNYGVHPGQGTEDSDWWLVEFDNDDYDDETDTSAIEALPPTFEVESPHTDADSPGHQYYRAGEEAIEVVDDLTGTLNPEPEWGEIKIEGKYVVGPGSQLDGCTKEWCEECSTADGGYYRIANDREIATIRPNDMRAVLDTEGDTDDLGDTTVGDHDGDNEEDNGTTEDYDGPELSEEQVEEALDHVDPTLGYSEWLAVGFAVHDWDDGPTGKRLFESWSRSNAKWDKERGQRHIDDIWTNGDKAGERTKAASVGTLVHHAKEGRWSGLSPSPAPVSNGEDSDGIPQPAFGEASSVETATTDTPSNGVTGTISGKK